VQCTVWERGQVTNLNSCCVHSFPGPGAGNRLVYVVI
jgi:hypothetical protein